MALLGGLAPDFSQHADQHRSKNSILLAVDEQLGEGAALWVAPELADPVDPVDPVEVGEPEDVEEFGTSGGPERAVAYGRRSGIFGPGA
jgi:hypothetical protein